MRKTLKPLVFAAALAQIFASSGFAETSSQKPQELYDTYFFSSSNQTLKARGAAISGSPGALLEDTGDSYRLLKGIATIKTAQSPISIDLGKGVKQVPANSTQTLQAIDSTGANQQSAAPPPLHNQGGNPLFIVGDCLGLQSLGKQHAISMAQGMVLFCPQNDLTIHLPLGEIRSNTGSKFLVKCDASEVRILCCSGNGLTYHYANKFRHIRPSQEFAVFDHRPFQAEVLPSDGIGRKDITMHDIDGQTMTAASNSFSVVSLLKSPNYLGSWQRKSSLDKRLTKSIIKTAAVHAAAAPSVQDFYRSPRLQDKAISPSASFRN
ncbi:MAG: hypothetical protein KIT34_10165 [Cyanobacteria bacterium TGS_CYA1]|nr:hypothetical protein [Cyanobacteria bacterium TGS_CYA1]